MSDAAKPQPKPVFGSTVWADFQSELAAKASKDENFREELLADPKDVLGKEMAKLAKEMDKLPEDATHVGIPKNMKVVVLEQTEDTIYLIIPPLMSSATASDAAYDGELSVEQLDAVAGGSDDFCNGTACTLTIPGSADCFTY